MTSLAKVRQHMIPDSRSYYTEDSVVQVVHLTVSDLRESSTLQNDKIYTNYVKIHDSFVML